LETDEIENFSLNFVRQKVQSCQKLIFMYTISSIENTNIVAVHEGIESLDYKFFGHFPELQREQKKYIIENVIKMLAAVSRNFHNNSSLSFLIFHTNALLHLVDSFLCVYFNVHDFISCKSNNHLSLKICKVVVL
jgi:hypothetical protein